MKRILSRRISWDWAATLLIAAAYVVWLLSLPAWPSQDGPVHLYYTHVLGALLSHRPTVYARFYTIKHLLPPYALYYYALLGLSKFVSLALADRIVLCVYVVSFIFGFRYMARALGPAADAMTLLATLLLLNWSLGMGFVNFCLALSFAFWALGLWLRFRGRAGQRAQRAGFVLLAVLALFTHPVPLALLLLYAAIDFGARLLRRLFAPAMGGEAPAQAHFVADLVTLVVAALTLGYVRFFTSSRPFTQTPVAANSSSLGVELFRNILNYAAEKGLAFLSGPGPELRLYRVILLAVLVVALALAVRQRLRNRARGVWTLADGVLMLGVIALVLLPFVPHDLNASHFFADRLLLIVWILPLLAASGYVFDRQRSRVALTIFVVLGQVLILYTAEVHVRPAARMIAAAERGPAALPVDAVGFLLEDRRAADAPPGLTFNPFLWGGVNAFRHSDAVLGNTPWLDLAIIPLAGTPALPASRLPPDALEFPAKLRDLLEANPGQPGALRWPVSFVAVDQAFRSQAMGIDPLLASVSPAVRWTCDDAAGGWLRVCRSGSL
jgi:hypothetical protein